MRLKQLKLVNFGKFSKTTIDFNDGLNLVVGPNEAGKSTVQSALKVAFFGERQGYQRWKRWKTDSPTCAIRVDYSLADGTAWRLDRDLAKSGVKLAQTKGGKSVVDGPTNVARAIGKHLGLDNADTFTNTVFVRVKELAIELKEIEPSLQARLESILVGSGGGSISGATKALNTRYRRLAGTIRQNGKGGEIGQLMEKEAGSKSALAQAEQAELSRQDVVTKLEETETLLAEKESRLNVVSQLVDAVKAKLSIKKQVDQINAERQKMRLKVERIKDDRKKTEAIKAEMEGLHIYKDVTGTDAAALQSKVNNIKTKDFELNLAADGGGTVKAPAPAVSRTVLFAAAAAALVVAVVLAIIGQVIVGLFLATLGLVSLVIGFSVDKPEVVAHDSRTVYIKQEIKRLQSEIKEELAKKGAPDVETFVASQHKFDSLAKEIASMTNAESIMLEGSSLEEMTKELDHLYDRGAALERQLSSSTEANLSAEEIFAGEQEFKELEVGVVDLRRTRDNLNGRLASHLELLGTPVDDLRADVAFVSESLSKVEEYAAAVELAAKEISTLAKEISNEVAPDIADKASRYLKELTGERYPRINIGTDLTPAIIGDGKTITPEMLSTGTADQMHFAIRLAAADLISGDSRPPLILDDPFVYFDAKRSAAARDIVIRLAATRQVILFSHDEAVKDWSGRLIDL